MPTITEDRLVSRYFHPKSVSLTNKESFRRCTSYLLLGAPAYEQHCAAICFAQFQHKIEATVDASGEFTIDQAALDAYYEDNEDDLPELLLSERSAAAVFASNPTWANYVRYLSLSLPSTMLNDLDFMIYDFTGSLAQLDAIRQNDWEALRYIPEAMQGDEALIRTGMLQDVAAIACASRDLRIQLMQEAVDESARRGSRSEHRGRATSPTSDKSEEILVFS